MVRKTAALVLSSLLLTAFAGSSDLPAPQTDEPTVKAEDIARTYSISPDSVDRLKEAYSIGYGGISKALALAQKSGLSVDAILQMKTRDNLGWGEIAQRLNLDPGKDYRAESAADKDRNMDRKLASAEKRAEHRAEKMEKKMDKNKGVARN